MRRTNTWETENTVKKQQFFHSYFDLLACPRVNNKYAQNNQVNKEIKGNKKETWIFKS